ncbi:transcriptional repressor [uncultured Treponema sp.]|uniref:Fur family transcriptional regulator n=1 Tax=uncultured Treponema sp. TaxID=162155 RepID=UPI0025954D04|nr:transcriptional repressor [uncultured Treponema sp.]
MQESIVFDAVQKLHNHATADEIFTEVTRQNPRISRGTVYRNLNKLTQAGKIKKVSVSEGADRFDHMKIEHYHIRCECCGKLFDVDMDCIKGLDRNIKDKKGFLFTGYDIIFRGICPDCRTDNQDTLPC